MLMTDGLWHCFTHIPKVLAVSKCPDSFYFFLVCANLQQFLGLKKLSVIIVIIKTIELGEHDITWPVSKWSIFSVGCWVSNDSKNPNKKHRLSTSWSQFKFVKVHHVSPSSWKFIMFPSFYNWPAICFIIFPQLNWMVSWKILWKMEDFGVLFQETSGNLHVSQLQQQKARPVGWQLDRCYCWCHASGSWASGTLRRYGVGCRESEMSETWAKTGSGVHCIQILIILYISYHI